MRGDFLAYREHFPNTPELPSTDPDATARFTEATAALADPASATSRAVDAALAGSEVVLVRGFLGNWMPGNLVQVRRALRRRGADAWIARHAAGRTIEDNAARLAARLATSGDRPLWLLGHSKGGMEALGAATRPHVEARLRGVLTAQTARGPSPVLESLLERKHQASLSGWHRRLAEAVQRIGLRLIGAHVGGLELTGERIRAAARQADEVVRPYPHVQAASWSIRPTTWLDSFHERLGEIAPGVAHDGQFYLHDLIWPNTPNVLLGEVDHAQPAMGGFGFDPVAFWLAMVAVALGRPGSSGG